jgi:hypothetical protein
MKSRCNKCPVLASVECRGDCPRVDVGDPFALYQAVDLSEGPAGIGRVWPGHPFALLSPRDGIGPTPSDSPAMSATLALVAACPDRGSVLPVSQQPECGCAELTECRRGKGARPGAVTLSECLACVSTITTP